MSDTIRFGENPYNPGPAISWADRLDPREIEREKDRVTAWHLKQMVNYVQAQAYRTAVQAERERCAGICEQIANDLRNDSLVRTGAYHCATAIRNGEGENG